jgi:hypothetical protein
MPSNANSSTNDKIPKVTGRYCRARMPGLPAGLAEVEWAGDVTAPA